VATPAYNSGVADSAEGGFCGGSIRLRQASQQFLNGEKPLSETIHIKTTENKEEGYKEVIITRAYKRPLDPREVQENFVRQMAEKLQ